ncbi:MAG: YiiD C-terminal domain-containing protein [Bacteroidetes bacterium]|nr:YiiD C-terminal domain-containing protein [Bacteroidota bacterium]
MDQLNRLVGKARNSSFYMWVLNMALLRTVPFNKPHRLKVLSITDTAVTIGARRIRANQNHIKGIHACLLATLCEYASGLSLLLHLSPAEYRIILKNIHMTYHYQAKKDVQVTFELKQEDMKKWFVEPLKTEDAVFHEFTVEVYDADRNHICTGLINWQVKAWKNVKSKM